MSQISQKSGVISFVENFKFITMNEFWNTKYINKSRDAVLATLAVFDIYAHSRNKYGITKMSKGLNKALGDFSFPSTYPEYLKTDNSKLMLSSLFKMSFKAFVEYSQMTACGQPLRFIMLSESFFNQLLQIKSFDILYSIIEDIIYRAQIFTGIHAEKTNNTKIMVENIADNQSNCITLYLSHNSQKHFFFSCFPHYICDRFYQSGFKNLSVQKPFLEMQGHMVEAIYVSKLNDGPYQQGAPVCRYNLLEKLNLLKTFRKVSTNYHRYIKSIRIAAKKSNNNIDSDLSLKPIFCDTLLPKDKRHFKVVSVLEPGHIAGRHFQKLKKRLVLPFEVVEVHPISDHASSELYLRSIIPSQKTRRFLDTFSGADVLKILEAIPGFSYRFNPAQKRLIGAQDSLVIVGRSGTGKSTCAVMRMVGIRLLEIAHRNVRKGIKKIRYQDMCEISDIKMLFMTASPLLARQISSVYHTLIEHIKEILKKKENLINQAQSNNKPAEKEAVENKSAEKEEKEPTEEVGEDSDEDVIILGDEEEDNPKKETEEEKRGHQKEADDATKNVLSEFDLSVLDKAEKSIEELTKSLQLSGDGSEVPTSYTELDQKDFPLFMTTSEFMCLLDSMMPESFFARDQKNTLKSEYNSLNKIKMFHRFKESMTGNRILNSVAQKKDVFEPENEVRNLKMHGLTSQLRNLNLNADEMTRVVIQVEYKDFAEDFYPEFLKSLKSQVVHYKNVSPSEFWPYIRNLDTCAFYTDYVSNKSFRDKLSQVSKAYKEWKEKTGNFDLNDLYEHTSKQLITDQIFGNFIDFLFVDEIQDIPTHILSYLKRFSYKSFFFCGDNAQNITKGTEFKFKKLARDLETSYKPVIFEHLNVNYRSHQRILDVGNNLVYMLRLFFPTHIEFLKSEESQKEGPKPVVIKLGLQEELLFKTLNNRLGCITKEKMDQEENEVTGLKTNVVFITRDFKSKEALKAKYKNIIVFTILEAKGMEFKNVVLYNYFTDSSVHAPFLIFKKYLRVLKRQKTQEAKEATVSNDLVSFYIRDQLQGEKKMDSESSNQLFELELNLTDYKEEIAKMKNTIYEAADELKLLYVAITRAKSSLFIFDTTSVFNESKHKRSFFDSIWGDIGLVELLDEQAIEANEPNPYFEKVTNLTQEEAIENGLEQFRRGNYEYAEIFFREGQFPKGYEAANLFKRTFALKNSLKTLKALKSGEQTEINSQDLYIEEEIEKIKKELYLLCEEMLERGLDSQAKSCCALIEEPEQLVHFFIKIKDYSGAALLYIEQKNFERAFEMFYKARDIVGIIQVMNEWSLRPEFLLKTMDALFQNDTLMSQSNKVAAAKKFVKKVALNCFIKHIKYLNDSIILTEEESLSALEASREKFITNVVKEINQEEIEPALEDFDKNRINEEPTPEAKPEPVAKKQENEEDGIIALSDDAFSNALSDVFENLQTEEYTSEKALSDSFVNLDSQNLLDTGRVDSDGSWSEEKNEPTQAQEVLNFELIKAFSNLTGLYCQYENMIYNTPKTKDQEQAEKEKVIEIGMVEMTETQFKNLKELVEEARAWLLYSHFFKKSSDPSFKSRTASDPESIDQMIKSFTLQLSSFSQIEQSFLDPAAFVSYLEQFSGGSKGISRAEKIRLGMLGYLSVFKYYSKSRIQSYLKLNPLARKAFLSMVSLLGFGKQILSLIEDQNQIETYLMAQADVESLMMLRLKRNQTSSSAKDKIPVFLSSLLKISGVEKLLKIYKEFPVSFADKSNEVVLEAGLRRFCIDYLWKRDTYYGQPDSLDDTSMAIKEFMKVNKPLGWTFKILQQYFSNKPISPELMNEYSSLASILYSRKNQLESGILLGVLFRLLVEDYQTCTLMNGTDSEADFSKFNLSELKIFQREVFQAGKQFSDINLIHDPIFGRIVEGFYMTMKVFNIPICELLSYEKSVGYYVHRSVSVNLFPNFPALNSSLVIACTDPLQDWFVISLSQVHISFYFDNTFILTQRLTKIRNKNSLRRKSSFLLDYVTLMGEKFHLTAQIGFKKSLLGDHKDDAPFGLSGKKKDMLKGGGQQNLAKEARKKIDAINTSLKQFRYPAENFERMFSISWKTSYPNKKGDQYKNLSSLFFHKEFHGFFKHLHSINSFTLVMIIAFYNFCASQNALGLFDNFEETFTKKHRSVKTFINLLKDSELSFYTGNIEEFVLEKLDMLDQFNEFEVAPEGQAFGKTLIIQDIVTGLLLGGERPKGQNLVPKRLLERRFGKIDGQVGSLKELFEKTEFYDSSLVFTKLSKKTIKTVSNDLKAYNCFSDASLLPILNYYFESKGTASKENFIINDAASETVKDENYDRYEKMKATVDKRSKQFKTLLSCVTKIMTKSLSFKPKSFFVNRLLTHIENIIAPPILPIVGEYLKGLKLNLYQEDLVDTLYRLSEQKLQDESTGASKVYLTRPLNFYTSGSDPLKTMKAKEPSNILQEISSLMKKISKTCIPEAVNVSFALTNQEIIYSYLLEYFCLKKILFEEVLASRYLKPWDSRVLARDKAAKNKGMDPVEIEVQEFQKIDSPTSIPGKVLSKFHESYYQTLIEEAKMIYNSKSFPRSIEIENKILETVVEEAPVEQMVVASLEARMSKLKAQLYKDHKKRKQVQQYVSNIMKRFK